MAAIFCKDLTRRFGNFTAVDHLSPQVASGQSTTIKMLTGLLELTSGEMHVLRQT